MMGLEGWQPRVILDILRPKIRKHPEIAVTKARRWIDPVGKAVDLLTH